MNFKYFLLILILGAISIDSFASTNSKKRSASDQGTDIGTDESQEPAPKRPQVLPDLQKELTLDQQKVLLFICYRVFDRNNKTDDGSSWVTSTEYSHFVKVPNILINDQPLEVYHYFFHPKKNYTVFPIKGVAYSQFAVKSDKFLKYCHEGCTLFNSSKDPQEIFQGSPVTWVDTEKRMVLLTNPSASDQKFLDQIRIIDSDTDSDTEELPAPSASSQ